MNITGLLDKTISLEQRVEILKRSYDNDFKELENLDENVIRQITSRVNELIRESISKQTELDMLFQEQNRILNEKEKEKTDIKNLNSLGIKDLNTRRNSAITKVDEIMESKSKVNIDFDIVEKLNEKKISIENGLLDDSKKQIEASISNINGNVERLNNLISKWSNTLKKYLTEEQNLKEALSNLIGQDDTPEKDELFNTKLSELEVVEQKIIKSNNGLEKYRRQLEEEQSKLINYEKNQEKQLKIDKKLEIKEEKNQEKLKEKREDIDSYITEFESICSKYELGFLEKEKRASLYHVLANAKVLEDSEKSRIFNMYVTSVNKTGKEIVGKCSDELKPQKQIPIISSMRSVVAKGSISTINKMSKVFDKVKMFGINIAANVVQKVQKHKEDSILNSIDNLGKLQEIGESLKAMKSMQEEGIKPMTM